MKPRPTFLLSWLLILAVTLTACGGGSTPAPTQPPAAAATSAPTQPPAAEATSAPTETKPPEPTATSQPTATSEPTVEPTPTLEPTPALPALEDEPGGYVFTNANEVRALAVYDGKLYAAGPGGVAAWDLANGTYRKYTTTLDGMSHIHVNAVTVCNMPEPRLVFGLETGVDTFDPATGIWQKLIINGADDYVNRAKVWVLRCDEANSRLLIGYDGVGIYNYANGSFTRFTTEQGLSWNGVSDIAVKGTDIWVASGYNGVSLIQGDKVTVYNEAAGMPNERARSLALAADGTLWVGTSGGLAKFKGNAWSFYKDGVPGEISSLTATSDGSVWLTSYPIGVGRVCQFDPAAEACAYTYEYNKDGISDLALTDDRIFFSAPQGVYALPYGGDTAEAWTIAFDRLASNFVDSFALDANGQLWVGTGAGVQVVNPANSSNEWTTFRRSSGDTSGSGGNWASFMCPDAAGGMWVVYTNGDLSYYDGVGNWTVYEDYYSVSAVAEDDEGRVWVSDDDKPIAVLQDGEKVAEYTVDDGLPGGYLTALYNDGAALWIGGNGLSRYAAGKLEAVFAKDELPGGAVVGLTRDMDGHLLIATYNAVLRYDGSNLTTLLQGEFGSAMLDAYTSLSGVAADAVGNIYLSSYGGLFRSSDNGATWIKITTADGIPTGLINALIMDQYGTLWFGGGSSFGGGGLARFVP